MVFSQTSLKTHSILKVVELDRLKPGKNQQVNGATGVITGLNTLPTPSSPMPTTSFCEELLKPEPELQSAMFHNSDSEFFQDLVQWCAAPVEEEVVQSIDSHKHTETGAHNTDTLHTSFSPQGWEAIDANSPTALTGLYNPAYSYQVPPKIDEMAKFNTEFFGPTDKAAADIEPFQEQFLDISNLPVVLGDLASEKPVETHMWQPADAFHWQTTQDTEYIKNNSNAHFTMPFIDQEDSMDMKYVSVIPREVERNNVVISEYIINDDGGPGEIQREAEVDRCGAGPGLSVDVAPRMQLWPNDAISTPEVLSFVEQMEKEKSILSSSKPEKQFIPDMDNFTKIDNSPHVDYDEPITPKSESHADSDEDVKSVSSKRRRHDSEESDETYTPYPEHTTRKYKRRKPSIPIKDMIRALEGSQQLTKARRGRPPKRRDSAVSSVCSVDENSSNVSTHEVKYRELRDKNNEASKRSRMNRKLKELQMEQLAIELEERNKKLRVRSEMLENMTKKLREAFMAAVSQKKLNG